MSGLTALNAQPLAAAPATRLPARSSAQINESLATPAAQLRGGHEQSGMRSFNPARFLPRVSTLSFVGIAAVATGAGLLIRDAIGSQAWLKAIKDGLVHAGGEIKTFFTETVPALSSTTAIASYIGIGAFLASLVNLSVFARGIQDPNPRLSQQMQRSLVTVLSGAGAGAAWGAMAGTLGAGAGVAPGAILGAGIGAAVGLAQAVLMLVRTAAIGQK